MEKEMHHVPVTISADTARDLYRAYQKHKHWSTPIDREVMAAYQKLAQGKLVIKALESITTAGLDEHGLPKLAIARADAKVCHLSMRGNGGAVMSTGQRVPSPRRNVTLTTRFDWPSGTFSPSTSWRDAEAIVPQPPLHLRPKRALQNYHVLFEADWTKAPPVDPFLIRRLGKGDLWLVLAMWDLTEVERAALSARL
jgi:hypothetical protein